MWKHCCNVMNTAADCAAAKVYPSLDGYDLSYISVILQAATTAEPSAGYQRLAGPSPTRAELTCLTCSCGPREDGDTEGCGSTAW